MEQDAAKRIVPAILLRNGPAEINAHRLIFLPMSFDILPLICREGNSVSIKDRAPRNNRCSLQETGIVGKTMLFVCLIRKRRLRHQFIRAPHLNSESGGGYERQADSHTHFQNFYTLSKPVGGVERRRLSIRNGDDHAEDNKARQKGRAAVTEKWRRDAGQRNQS